MVAKDAKGRLLAQWAGREPLGRTRGGQHNGCYNRQGGGVVAGVPWFAEKSEGSKRVGHGGLEPVPGAECTVLLSASL